MENPVSRQYPVSDDKIYINIHVLEFIEIGAKVVFTNRKSRRFRREKRVPKVGLEPTRRITFEGF